MGQKRSEDLSKFNASQPTLKSLENYFLNKEKILKYLKNKTVYCNCDDPYQSIVFRFLCLNFKKLELSKVITTNKNDNLEKTYKFEIIKQPPELFINRYNFNVDTMLKCGFLTKTEINGDGSYNSEDCMKILSRCDVVLTKPDINDFNEYFNTIARSDKYFWVVTPFEKTLEFNPFRNIKHFKAKIDDNITFKYVDDENNTNEFDEIYSVTNMNLFDRENLFSEPKKKKIKCFKLNVRQDLKRFLHKKHTTVLSIPSKKIKSYKQQEKTTLKKLDNYNAYLLDDIKKLPQNNSVYAVSLEYLKHYNHKEVEIIGITRPNLNKEQSLKFVYTENETNCHAFVDGVEIKDDLLFVTKRKNYASMDFDWYRDNIFKKYSEYELQRQLDAFINQEHDLNVINDKGSSYNKLINQFLEEVLYSARKSKVKYSPCDSMDVEHEDIFTRIINYIANKPRFFSDDNCVINLKRFYSGACKIAPKVANFSPNTACKIYERLCPKEGANIYDYSCGFGARMLGSLGSKYNYHYFGTDPNERLCEQLNKMGEWINSHCTKPSTFKVYCQGSEIFIDELEGKIDLAFSSPPYFDLEVYTNDDKQCENKHKGNYPAWVELYVKPTVQNIKRYLKEDGIFALNIKNGTYGGYEHLLDDWTKCAEDEGFEIVDELTMYHQSARIALSNYMVQKYGEGYELKSGTEPVRVFKIKKNNKETCDKNDSINVIETQPKENKNEENIVKFKEPKQLSLF